ncbi:hypothetical protein [Staphylococcus carnosus]
MKTRNEDQVKEALSVLVSAVKKLRQEQGQETA